MPWASVKTWASSRTTETTFELSEPVHVVSPYEERGRHPVVQVTAMSVEVVEHQDGRLNWTISHSGRRVRADGTVGSPYSPHVTAYSLRNGYTLSQAQCAALHYALLRHRAEHGSAGAALLDLIDSTATGIEV